MGVVFIENGDSFSWNVVDRLPCPREAVTLVSGRDGRSVQAALETADCVVMGPGPMDPVRAGLVDHVLYAAARGIPVLGVCLGHQAIGLAFGARLRREQPAHGRLDTARFTGTRWLHPLAGDYTVMRYHSLVLDSVVAPLRVVATTPAGLVMAIEHQSLPIAGMQFHPDSSGTPHGAAMLAAFFRSVS